MRRLLTFAGLAAAGAAIYRRITGGRSDITSAPSSSDAPSGSAPDPAAHSGSENLTAQAPPEAPGPSVRGPVAADEQEPLPPDPERMAERTQDPTEALVREEEEKAAAEAAAIGGEAPSDESDPAMRPVVEAGGGQAEGFELAEEQLIENASHGEGTAKPHLDAMTPEKESDRAGAVYGEADEPDVSEVTSDPNPDASSEAGEGPGRAHDV